MFFKFLDLQIVSTMRSVSFAFICYFKKIICQKQKNRYYLVINFSVRYINSLELQEGWVICSVSLDPGLSLDPLFLILVWTSEQILRSAQLVLLRRFLLLVWYLYLYRLKVLNYFIYTIKISSYAKYPLTLKKKTCTLFLY